MPFHADDEHRFDFRDGSESYPVYADGVGPGVLIMHELPGLTARCVDLAGRVQDGGFRVYAPLFFGRPGETNEVIGSARAFWFLCVRREIEVLATQRSSRISGWVRALCRR